MTVPATGAGVVLDLVLVLVLVGYTVSGYRSGLVARVLSVLGFGAGGVLGMVFVPRLVEGVRPGLGRSVAVLAGVLVLAWVGQAVGAVAGRALRRRVTWRPVRLLDAGLGALAAMLAVAMMTWFVAGAVRGGPAPVVSRAVASSQVVAVVDRAMPDAVSRLFSDFGAAVQAGGFPRVFEGLAPERIIAVDPPDPAEVGPAATAAAGGIVKVTGVAECARGQEGSGWVVAPGRVVTNAHVVAGVDSPVVQVGGQGERLAGQVVLFDPGRDLAVLAVPDLRAQPLPLGRDLAGGAAAVVAGFPLDGPFRAEAARVREVVQARGQDIYGQPGVVREVYSLFAVVEPGNSGGPLLDPTGAVVGVVFARSLDDPQTGYALTLAESAPVLSAASTVSGPVDSGACTPG